MAQPEMTSRERVRCALSHRTPDRTPLDIGGSNLTSMVDSAYETLKAYLGITSETTYLGRRARLVRVDEAVASALGTDLRPVVLGAPDRAPDVFAADGSVTDEWQVVWRSAGGHYNPVGSPLACATTADLQRFAWPDPHDPGRTRDLGQQARALHENTDKAVVLALPVAVVHLSQYLRGYDQYLIDLLTDEAFAQAMMERIMAFYLALVSDALEAAGPYVDVVAFADDVAFQDRPMVRMDTYRRLIKPHHAGIVKLIKSRTKAAVMYHCCGAVAPLIPDLIEIGVDALNPVQVSAEGMADTAALKRAFGADITFWGGIDTQHVLPHGSAQEVREEVRRRLEDLAVQGGYVAAAVHDIQTDVPPENVVAMAETVREFAGR
ncbi:MAG: uroporphyrinogen decarboxylase family protein [Anaerolineae bacterium]